MELGVIGRKEISQKDIAKIWARDPVSLGKNGDSGEKRGMINGGAREAGGRTDETQ